jgi:rubrerythrin
VASAITSPTTTEDLLAILTAHVDGESEHVEAYRRLAHTMNDPIVKMLMDLVIEDEERHHDLMRRMSARLRDDLEATRSDSALPYAPSPRNGRLKGFAAIVEAYAKDERQGIRQLRRLASDAGLIYDGVFALLLETMADDSAKHERVMRFVLRRIAE